MAYFNSKIILVMVLGYGGYLVLTDRMSHDELVKILLYQMQLTEYIYVSHSLQITLQWIMDQYSTLMESVGSSRKIFEYIERRPKLLNEGKDKAPIEGNVEFASVSFSYPTRPNNVVLKVLTKNLFTLQDLNLSFKAGQTVALVGPSGGGKSSIVSLLEHFYQPNAGKILVDSVDISKFDHTHYHEKVQTFRRPTPRSPSWPKNRCCTTRPSARTSSTAVTGRRRRTC